MKVAKVTSIWFGTIHTSSWTFETFSTTKARATKALREAWKEHQQTDTDRRTFARLRDEGEVTVAWRDLDTVYRNGDGFSWLTKGAN